MKMYISCVLRWKSAPVTDPKSKCEPPSVYPVDNVPTHPHRVRGIQQPLLSTFQHVPLVHQIVQNRLPLRDKIIQRGLRVLDKTVLSQRVVLSGGGHEVWWL